MRSRHSPPPPRANSQLKRNVRTPPMCRNPVGDGAMRTRNGTRARLRAVLLGAHARSGGIKAAIDRAEEIGARRGPALRAEPAHVAVPRSTSRRRSSVPRADRAEAGVGAVAVHALYLINLASAERTSSTRSPRRRASATRSTPRPRSTPTASSSTSARISAAGFEAGLEARRPGDAAGARPHDRHDVAADGELGRRRRHDRPLGRGARR